MAKPKSDPSVKPEAKSKAKSATKSATKLQTKSAGQTSQTTPKPAKKSTSTKTAQQASPKAASGQQDEAKIVASEQGRKSRAKTKAAQPKRSKAGRLSAAGDEVQSAKLENSVLPVFHPEIVDDVESPGPIARLEDLDDAELYVNSDEDTKLLGDEAAEDEPVGVAQFVPEASVNPKSGSGQITTALTAIDPVTTYLAEIRRYPLLSREQEQELAIRYRETGDSKAAEALVTANLRFVVKVAAEYSKFGAKLIDLIQEGNVGLMHAVREFNPYKGVRLITYAVWWIRGYIQEYLMRQYSLVRIGTTQNQRKLFYRLQKEKDLLDSMGEHPNYALLGSRLGVSAEEVETMTQRLSGRDVSLNQPLDSEGTTSLLDFESSSEAGVDDRIGLAEELSALRKNIESIKDSLNEKEKYVLEHRLLSDEPKTLQEIGDHFSITREAVRQLEARLLNKIKNALTQTLTPSEES